MMERLVEQGIEMREEMKKMREGLVIAVKKR